MIIQVKKKHIKAHIPFDGTANCPVALAIYEQTGKPASVGLKDVYVYNNLEAAKMLNTRKSRKIDLPRSAQRFISKFDQDKPVKPFNFKLNYDSKRKN